MRSQVGRPWNDVYSEICTNIDPRNKSGFRLKRFIRWMVTLKPRFTIDGKAIWFTRDHFDVFIKKGQFYVDQEGILREGTF